MKQYFLTLALLVGFIGIATAQKAPIKFGQISKADLLNNVYAPDTSAPAVILCDYGIFTDQRFQTLRILRIKILKKEGYDWANQTFGTDSKTDIKGITYNLENSEIVETKLKKESIFSTRITDDYYEMRVAMPNVKVGSIIDIQFLYDGIPDEWDFQQEIPVVHSELVIEPSIYLTYNKNFFGFVGLAVATNGRWVSQNVPAFKPEPYMSSSKNYRSRMEFEIETVSFPGYYRSYTTSWEKVRDLLYESTYFGTALNADGYLKSVANDIKASCTTQDEMIKAAYNYTKKMNWDGSDRLFTDNTSLNTAFKKGKGNSAEVNLALVQLLRKLDFDAGPVVMSTRSNGRLSPFQPSLHKPNYVIAAIFNKNDTLLLDATETHCPYYLLPMRALNGQAQFMDKTRTGWVNLVTKKKDKQMIMYTMSVEDDFSLKGKMVFSKGDYAALDFRNDYEDFNSDDEYLTNYKEGKKGLKVISHKIDNLDSLYKPITEEFDVTISNGVSEIDGELYITPVLFEQIKENPFKVSERKYPIDFGYARDKTVIANFTIPNGYSVVNIPANITIKLPGDAATFSCKSAVNEGKISIVMKFNINKSVILQTQYPDLREFYNQIIAKEAEPIVLKKS